MLNNRVQDLCYVMNFNYFKVLTSENYMKYFKSQFLGKVRNNCNGTIDSIRLVLKSKDNYSPSLLKLLLKAVILLTLFIIVVTFIFVMLILL